MADKENGKSDGSGILNLFNPLASGASRGSRIARGVMLLALIYILTGLCICWYEYDRAFAPFFDPRPSPEAAKAEPPKAGMVFTGTLITMGDRLLVAWLPNDILYPTVMMDNPQNYQMGVLEVLRYSTRVLRDNLSRQRTTDRIDPNADKAFTDFSNDPKKWIFPSAESKFRSAVEQLTAYRDNLAQGKAHFYPRTDNLIDLLDQYRSLLGGVSTRLSNAPSDTRFRLSEETAGDPNLAGERITEVKVPWTERDDNFYFARGVAYGIREAMLAAEWEFRDVLAMKKADELFINIIDELNRADYAPLFILNGARDSVFANHSLTMMATVESVRQKMSSLQSMLER